MRRPPEVPDPGLQFDDTINKWAHLQGHRPHLRIESLQRVRLLDDTACNLASLNLLSSPEPDGSPGGRAEGGGIGGKTGRFDVDTYKHACRIFFLAQEIAVDLAS